MCLGQHCRTSPTSSGVLCMAMALISACGGMSTWRDNSYEGE